MFGFGGKGGMWGHTPHAANDRLVKAIDYAEQNSATKFTPDWDGMILEQGRLD